MSTSGCERCFLFTICRDYILPFTDFRIGICCKLESRMNNLVRITKPPGKVAKEKFTKNEYIKKKTSDGILWAGFRSEVTVLRKQRRRQAS